MSGIRPLDHSARFFPKPASKKIESSPIPVPVVEHALVDRIVPDSISRLRWEPLSAPAQSFSSVSVASYYRQAVEQMVQAGEIQSTPEMEQFLDELRGMLEIENEIQVIKSGKELTGQEKANQFIQLMQRTLQGLKTGKSLLVRGGWKSDHSEEDSCAILYRITKKSEREFVFELYNTGEGLEYHPRGILQEQEVFVQRLQKTVAASALLDPLFWQAQYELLYDPPDKASPCGPTEFYNWLDQLGGSSFLEKARQETLRQKDAEFRRPQRGKNGLCDTLFLYTKSYFKGKQRSIYHTLKRQIQFSTFNKYWDSLNLSKKTESRILDGLSQKIEKIQKKLFKDVSKGRVSAAQVDTIVKDLKKRQLILRDLRATSWGEVASSGMEECGALEPASIEEHTQELPLATDLSSATTVSMHKSIISLSSELETDSLVSCLLDDNQKTNEINRIDSSIFDQQIWHLPRHDDKIWNDLTEKQATAVFHKLTACIRRIAHLQLTDLSVFYLYVHLFALLVKLAPKTKDFFLSTIQIDRQFVSRLVEPPFSSLITSLDAEQAKQLADHLSFLWQNTQENGLFHEYFDREPRIVCGKNPKPGSLGHSFREYWNSRKNDKKFREQLTQDLRDPLTGEPEPQLKNLEKDLDHPEWVRRVIPWCHNRETDSSLKILQDMESVLVQMQRQFRIETPMRFEREEGIFNQPKSDDLVVKNIKWKNGMFVHEFRLQKGLFFSEKDSQFLDCFQSRSEEEIRDAYVGKELSVEDELDFEFSLIHSADDPGLRIARAIEFFRGHKALLKQEKCRKFLWATLFQVSLRGATVEEHIPLIHYLNTTKDGWEQISQFVQDGYAIFKDDQDPDLAIGFWELAVTIADYQSVFLHKKSCLLPCNALVQLIKKLEEESDRLNSCASRYCSLFPEAIPVLSPLIKDRSAFKENLGEYERGRWPFPVYRSVFTERFKGLKAEERDLALSQYVFGRESASLKWEHAPEKATLYSFGNYTVDLRSGEIFVRGCTEPLTPPAERMLAILKQDSFWKQTFSEKKIHFIGSFEEKSGEIKMIFIDTKTQEEYIAEYLFEGKAIQGFYCRKKDSSDWESLFSIHRFSSDPKSILHTMGLTAQNGWSIEKKSDGRLFLRQEAESEARFALVEKESSFQLHDLSDPKHPLVLIDPKTRWNAFSKKLLKLDEKGFFWAESTQGSGLVVRRFYSPKWERTFLIDKGQIHDAETGWEYLPDFTLRSLSEASPEGVVFQDPLSRQRKVLFLESLSERSGRSKLYQFDVDPKGRHLTSTTREEDLYLAKVLLKNKKHKAVLSCLNRSGRRTGGYTLQELRLLRSIFYETELLEETLPIRIKSALLLKQSLDPSGLGWEEPKRGEEEDANALKEFVTRLNVSENFQKYRSLITAWPNALKLRDEDSLAIMRIWPSTNEKRISWWVRLKWKWAEYISEFSLDQRRFLETSLNNLKANWKQQADFLDKSLPPLRITIKDIDSRFAQFYHIAKNGKKEQREQLENWLRSFIALHPEKQDCVVFVRFFLRLLRLSGRGRARLQNVALLALWNNGKEEKSMIDALHRSVGIFPCFIGSKMRLSEPIPLSSSLHPQSVRNKQLQVNDAPMQRFSAKNLLKKVQEMGTTALLPPDMLGAFIKKKKEKGGDTAISILPLDSLGGAAYQRSFTNLEASLKAAQQQMQDTPEWTISPAHRIALEKTIREESTIKKTEFDGKKTKLLEMARSFLPKEKQLEWDLGVASQWQKALKWSDILFLFAKQDLQLYRQRIPHLTEEQAHKIYTKTAECLCELTRLQRLEQAGTLMQQMGEEPDPRLVGQVKTLLDGKESYPVDVYPSILLFEALTKKQLRKDQLDNLSKLTDPQSHWLIEAIMGSGKSEILLPLFAQTVADGQHLSITVIPKEQMHSAGSRLERRLQELFDQDSVRIDWRNVSKENLQAIYARLQKAIQKGQVLRIYADELQQFFLEEQALFEAHLQGNPGAIEQLNIFRSIRQLFKEKGVALVDEVHLQLMRKRECQKPLGEKQSVPSSYQNMAAKLQGLLISEEIRKQFFLQIHKTPQKGAIPFVAEKHKEELINLLTQAFAKQSTLQSSQENIIRFLTVPDEEVSTMLQALDPSEREVLSFARGQIRTILPATLSRKCGEDYGCFPAQKEGEAPSYLAGPFRLSRPVYGSTFATPDELLAFTMQSYLIQGVSLPLAKEMFDQLLQQGKQQKLLSNISLHETRAYATYLQIMGKEFAISLDKLDDDNHYQKIVEAINGDPAILLRFIEYFILPKVEQYPVTAFVNGYSFFSRFLSVKGVSGTLQDAFTLHHRFQKHLRPDIEGVAFRLLTTQPPRGLTEPLKDIALLEHLFKPGERPKQLRAIIDQGNLIQVDPEKVAGKILEKMDETIQRVIYFAGDEQMVLERGGKALHKYDPAKHPKESSFTFYDQAHATGTDIAQEAQATAWVTVSETTSYTDACQAGFRLRNLEGGQSVQFIMSYELVSALKLHKIENPTAADVLRHAKHIQAKNSLEENFKAVLDQLKELFLEQCRYILDRNPNDKTIFHAMLRANAMDPIATYGTSLQEKDPKEIFADVKKDLLHQLNSRLKKSDRQAVEKEMDQIIGEAIGTSERQVPERVLAKSSPSTSTGTELQLEQQQEKQQEQQQEQSTLRLFFPKRKPQRESIPRFLPHSSFASNSFALNLGEIAKISVLPKKKYKNPPSPSVYPIAALLRDRVQRGGEKITLSKNFFDTLSAKVLFSLDAVSQETYLPPFGSNRKECGGLLLVPDPAAPKSPYIIALSKAESEAWRNAIHHQETQLPKGFENCSLFLPGLQTESGAGVVASRDTSLEPKQFQGKLGDPCTPFEQSFALTKWLLGECSTYTAKEEAYLASWLKGQQPSDLPGVEQLFTTCLRQRETYQGSTVAEIMHAIATPQEKSVQKPSKKMREGENRSFISPVKKGLIFCGKVLLFPVVLPFLVLRKIFFSKN